MKFNKKFNKPSWLLFGFLLLGAFVFLVACSGGTPKSESAPKEKFPEGPVKIILTHDVGSTIDVSMRGFAPYFQEALGVPVVVENMPGAGGSKARDFVFQAEPDGYTLLASNFPSTQLGELTKPSKYKTLEFTHIASIFGNNWKAIAVKADSPYRTFNDLLEASKTKELAIGASGGVGSSSHLQSVLLQKIGLKHRYVPFNGTAEAMTALLGGQVSALFNDHVGLLRFKDQIRILALHSPERLPELPDVPTLKELGYEGLEIPFLTGLFAPPGLPKERLAILEEAVKKAVDNPAFQDWAKKSENFIQYMNSEEFYKTSQALYNQMAPLAPLLKGGQ